MDKNDHYLDLKDLWSLLEQTDEMRVNGCVIDDASLEVMLRIERKMSHLPVTADDQGRQIWIEVRDRLGRHLWYQLLCANFHDFHYLMLSHDEEICVDLRSASHLGARRSDCPCMYDVKSALLKLESYVDSLAPRIPPQIIPMTTTAA